MCAKNFDCQNAQEMALSHGRTRRAELTETRHQSDRTSAPVRGGRDTGKSKKKPGKRREATRQGWTLRLQLKSNPEALSLVRAAVERAAELLHFGAVESRALVRSV